MKIFVSETMMLGLETYINMPFRRPYLRMYFEQKDILAKVLRMYTGPSWFLSYSYITFTNILVPTDT